MGEQAGCGRYAAVVLGFLGFFAGLSMLLERAGGGWVPGAVVMCVCAGVFLPAVALSTRGTRPRKPHPGSRNRDGDGHGDRNRGGERDPRIRSPRQRSVQDDAFLVTVVGQGGRGRGDGGTSGDHGAGAQAPVPPVPSGPVTARGGRDDVEFEVHGAGIRVRYKWPSAAGGTRWRVRFEASWQTIGSLSFDYGAHDSVVALYAIPPGGTRQHVVDARMFTHHQWTELAGSIAGHTHGRLTLDLTTREDPGPLRDG